MNTATKRWIGRERRRMARAHGATRGRRGARAVAFAAAHFSLVERLASERGEALLAAAQAAFQAHFSGACPALSPARARCLQRLVGLRQEELDAAVAHWIAAGAVVAPL